MWLVVTLITVTMVTTSYEQEFIRQCTCAEVEACKAVARRSVLSCSDQCQRFIPTGNYPMIRECFLQRTGILDATESCMEGIFPGWCARGTPIMVRRRSGISLQIAVVTEVNKLIQRSGIGQQSANLISLSRRFVRCFLSCFRARLRRCIRNCWFDLPSDNALVQGTKSCLIHSGLNTPTLQQICYCIEGAGVRELAGVCHRVQIFRKK